MASVPLQNPASTITKSSLGLICENLTNKNENYYLFFLFIFLLLLLLIIIIAKQHKA